MGFTTNFRAAVSIPVVALVIVLASASEQSCTNTAEGACSPTSGANMMQLVSFDLKGSTADVDTALDTGVYVGADTTDIATDAHSFRLRAAYSVFLRRRVAAALTSEKPAASELKGMIERFIAQQSNSEDKCSAQLLAAKHQLNSLHVSINDLAIEVNATHMTITLSGSQLDSKHDDQDKADKVQKEGLKQAAATREEDQSMLHILKQELEEMQQIGRQGADASPVPVALASRSRRAMVLLEKPLAKHLAKHLAKPAPGLKGILQAARSAPAGKPSPISNVQGLVNETKTAVASLSACVQATSSSLDVGLVGIGSASNSKDPANTPSECAREKETLEKTYQKTFVELTRLITEKEDIVKSTAVEDAINEQHANKVDPIHRAIDKLVDKVEKLTEKLRELRPHLEDASEVEKKLRKQIATLTKQCALLPETVTDLDKVRSTIDALKLCPGLGKADFSSPVWTKQWAGVHQSAHQTDDDLDAAMDQACAEKAPARSGHSVRAAEVSEISVAAIEGMPTTNTATAAIIGACPACAGSLDADTGVEHADGHARICWDAGKAISSSTARKDCSNGIRAVLCVYEKVQHDDDDDNDERPEGNDQPTSTTTATNDNDNNNDKNNNKNSNHQTPATNHQPPPPTPATHNNNNNNNNNNVHNKKPT